MTKKKTSPPATFKVDNQFMHNAPQLVGIQPRGRPTAKGEPTIQLYLPGMAPFQPFDEWVTWGCYALLDPKDPTATVEVTISDFADLLEMGRQAVGQGDWLGFPSDVYQQVYEALLRLYSIEVDITFSRGRKFHAYKTRVLSGFGFVYPDGRQPEELPSHLRQNVNPFDEKFPVWKRLDARPVAVIFTMTQEMTQGLRNMGDSHIGATTLPLQVFALRGSVGRSFIATRLLSWVCRQVAIEPKISLTKLRKALNIAGRNVTRDRDSIRKALQLLKEKGVIESFSMDFDQVTCRKTSAYFYGKNGGRPDPE